jgi:Carboxypeptidase regulatory-like domain
MSINTFMIRTAMFSLLVMTLASSALAQFDNGQISGTVRDTSQSVVPSAMIEVKSSATGQSASAKADQSGSFLFVNLPVGYYDVSVQAAGFKAYTRTRVKVDAAARATVDVALEVGSITESVSVTAEAIATTMETAQIGRTIESKQINELALNGRNPFSMAVLKAGVIGDQFNGFNPGWVEQSVSINGGRKNGNAVTVDGVNMLRARGDATRLTRKVFTVLVEPIASSTVMLCGR